MKKSLLALAALSAIAGAAQAQSSVTVYGILDVGYIGSNAKEGTVTSPATGTQTNKIQKSAFGQSAEQTSRLGFKGTEDLGGGASAFFTVELGLTPANSELSGGTAADPYQKNTNNSGSTVDNRQSFVGLKKNGIGQFAFGRQYTNVFNEGAATSPGQYNNVAGDVVYAGGASSLFASSASQQSGNNNGEGFTNRASNALTLQSDSFGGFQAAAMYAMNNQNQTQVGTTNNPNTPTAANGGNTNWGGWGLSANFTWQKLYIGAAYQSFKTNYATGVFAAAPTSANANLGSVAVTSGQQVGGGVIFPATQTSDKQTLVGATYDFGILKAYAQWVGRKIQNDFSTDAVTSNAGEQFNRNAQQLGVRSYITPTVESWASVGNGKIKSSFGGQSATFVGWQLGTNYYLSKRTNLYGIYGQVQTGSTPSTGGVGAGGNQYALGLRHTF
ncbi:porin [Polynucleobacter sp. MWH-Adler-W8]|uniref:porin n=1 Tax=Polynucleobacter sp. MWH-Adler-W8 TaxID=1819727 RepID=UPI00092A430B|nr:porin [Polynucleobacter sp. MWH-Adler-W8]OJI06140.1 hypothetical protein AOC28_00835 [Polynucleobacter sp. MWH-Adler-W8]